MNWPKGHWKHWIYCTNLRETDITGYIEDSALGGHLQDLENLSATIWVREKPCFSTTTLGKTSQTTQWLPTTGTSLLNTEIQLRDQVFTEASSLLFPMNLSEKRKGIQILKIQKLSLECQRREISHSLFTQTIVYLVLGLNSTIWERKGKNSVFPFYKRIFIDAS